MNVYACDVVDHLDVRCKVGLPVGFYFDDGPSTSQVSKLSVLYRSRI